MIIEKDQWCISIDDECRWDIAPNPFGAGLVLVVHRGIWAAEHAQVVSFHTTDTPPQEYVNNVIVEKRKELLEKINKFISEQSVNPDESAGLIFCQELLKEIAIDAYERYASDIWQ